jgi:hypothetical protein
MNLKFSASQNSYRFLIDKKGLLDDGRGGGCGIGLADTRVSSLLFKLTSARDPTRSSTDEGFEASSLIIRF